MPTLFNNGDILRGDRIAINARRLSNPRVVNQSGRHNASSLTAHDPVYCMIEKPLSATPKKQS